jgi:predicted permease
MYALALRPLPVERPDQLVEVIQGSGANLHTYAEWKIFRDSQDIFSDVLAYDYFDTTFNIGSADHHEVSGLYVSGDYFSALGVQAVFGRALQPLDDQPGASPVCVLGSGLWQQLYGKSKNILGHAILVNGNEFQIVGVAPQAFLGVDIGSMPEIFMPLEAQRTYKDYPLLYGRQTPSLDDPHATLLSFVGRLKPGINLSQANAGLRVLSPEIHRALSPHPSEIGGGPPSSLMARSITSDTWLQDMDVVLLLMVMAAVALIIACANIGNLLLTRASKRQGEIAIRLALGATQWRLVRQLLTESVTLSLIGAAAGILVERWGSQALLWVLSYPDDPVQLDLSWDARLFAFAVGVTLFCALLCGLAPAIRPTRVSIYSALNKRMTTGGRREQFSNSLLVVLQVGLSMALLVSASLLARTLHALLAVDPGYDPKGILLAEASWQGTRESPQHGAFVGQEMLERLRSLPGVVSVSWSRTFSQMSLPRLAVREPAGGERQSACYLIFVSPDYFKTRRTPMPAGRDFNSNDTDASFPSAILSEALAKTLFPGVNPVGLSFRESDQRGTGDYPVEVVGGADDMQYRRPSDGPLPVLYRPVSQCGGSCSGIGSYEIRVSGPFPEMTKRLENTAAMVDPGIALRLSLMSEVIHNTVKRNYAMALIALTFGSFVCLLALIGVYGMTSYATAERTREIGIRMALGAKSGDILRMVLRETMNLMFIGIAFGVGAGLAATQLIQGLIWGVRPTDPLTFVLAAGLMLLIAGIAVLPPARRASKADPMVALRYE